MCKIICVKHFNYNIKTVNIHASERTLKCSIHLSVDLLRFVSFMNFLQLIRANLYHEVNLSQFNL